jgi:ATP-dependent DNA ligase
MSVPAAGADVLVYIHPQGKTIHVHPNGNMEVFKPDGKRSTSSATPAKLAAGHGGWTLASGSAGAGSIPELVGGVAASAPITAMTYSEVDFSEVPRLLMDDTVAAEQKLDGTRTVVVVAESGDVTFYGRNGQPLKHASAAAHFAALRPAFKTLSGSHVLDGEIISETGELWLFDLPQSTVTDGVKPSDPLRQRRTHLELLGAILEGRNPKIRVVPQATDAVEKARLLSAVSEAGGEGVMFKDLDAPYDGGVRVRHSVKAKFVKTADVVVLRRDTGGKKNADLGVWDPVRQDFFQVGACSMIGKADAQIGEVIEVAYLNWTGTKLYQPRFLKVRTDKRPTDCRAEQFPVYSKEVLA